MGDRKGATVSYACGSHRLLVFAGIVIWSGQAIVNIFVTTGEKLLERALAKLAPEEVDSKLRGFVRRNAIVRIFVRFTI